MRGLSKTNPTFKKPPDFGVFVMSAENRSHVRRLLAHLVATRNVPAGFMQFFLVVLWSFVLSDRASQYLHHPKIDYIEATGYSF